MNRSDVSKHHQLVRPWSSGTWGPHLANSTDSVQPHAACTPANSRSTLPAPGALLALSPPTWQGKCFGKSQLAGRRRSRVPGGTSGHAEERRSASLPATSVDLQAPGVLPCPFPSRPWQGGCVPLSWHSRPGSAPGSEHSERSRGAPRGLVV